MSLTAAEIALVKKHAKHVQFKAPDGTTFVAWGVSRGRKPRL